MRGYMGLHLEYAEYAMSPQRLLAQIFFHEPKYAYPDSREHVFEVRLRKAEEIGRRMIWC